ncbi:hypothetical protein BAE44_0009615 [Dichanthelium oligosanthes]|uniref:Uncharacterized protein n=1 Tax=Dichanthelium oligosanthes TaxID=888268 RepID=A0A1E5VW71_9POAL|nr:hypothetical protein BAE44_0009615 [Dichanthelium oligosanthes]
MEASAADQGYQKNQQTTYACHGSDGSNGKSRADLYAGAVAQRVLYGPSRGRGGSPRRVAAANGKPPSRLSKVSGAAEATGASTNTRS